MLDAIQQWVNSQLAKDSLYGALKELMIFSDPFDATIPLWRALVANDPKENLLADVLLPLARVLAMERRELFEYRRDLNPRVRHAGGLSSWNEQQAVKLVKALVMSEDSEVASLYDRLCAHVTEFCVGDEWDREASHRPTDLVGAFRIDTGRIDAETGNRVEEGRLLLARPLPPFAEFVRVPSHKLFNIRTAKSNSSFCKLLESAHGSTSAVVDDESLLLLTLTFEKFHVKDASHWVELLEGLPGDFNIVPTAWPMEDLAELEGCGVLDEVVEKLESLKRFSAEVDTLLASLESHLGSDSLTIATLRAVFSSENLNYIRAAMDSRAFYLNYGGGPDDILLTMAPVADMLNHDIKTMVLTRRIDKDTGDFVLETGPALNPGHVGKEVWMSYGPLQNWELLLSYGFVLPENENDRFPFPVVLEGTEDEWEIARSRIRAKHAIIAPAELFLGRDGRPSPTLVAMLRLQQAEAADYPGLEADPFAPCTAHPETERVVFETIRSCVDAVMANFPTSIEQDRALLLDESISTNRRNAVVMRLGLKEIGERALRHCDEKLVGE